MRTKSIPKLNAHKGMSAVWTATSRLVLLFTSLVLLLMPLTEYLWHFDNFLMGGQDFEFGLLSFATILCLVMVMLQHGKSSVTLSLSLRKRLSIVCRRHDYAAHGSSAHGPLMGLVAALHAVAAQSPSLDHYSLPLQI